MTERVVDIYPLCIDGIIPVYLNYSSAYTTHPTNLLNQESQDSSSRDERQDEGAWATPIGKLCP